MDSTREATEAFLDERPALEATLRELVDRDTEGPWTFGDLDVDSGVFGEVVSREFVESVDDGYRLCDRAAVRAALDGSDDRTDRASPGVRQWLTSPQVDVSRPTIVSLCGALALVVLARSFFFGSVFYNGSTILLGNDPYKALAQIESFSATVDGPFDPAVVTSVPIRGIRPLFLATLTWFVELLGGGPSVAGVVVAVFPVLGAVLTAVVVFSLARHLSGDVRLGLASVAVLAVTPPHVLRTALGFGDHHAFDYPLLALTTLCLVVLVIERSSRARTRWYYSVLFGLAVAWQVLAWRGSPLLLVPLVGSLVLVVPSILRLSRSPFEALQPVVAGLGIAAVGTLGPHLMFGWLRLSIALLPTVVFVGAIGLVVVGEIFHRQGWRPRSLLALEGAGVVAVLAVITLHPLFGSLLSRGMGYFSSRGRSSIAETQPLVGGEAAVFGGSILMFGLLLFAAIAVLGVATWQVYDRHRPGWLVLVVYTWYFVLLALFLQRRFAGELGMYVAVFAGTALVVAAAKIELIRPVSPFDPSSRVRSVSVPAPRTSAYLVLLFLLVCGVSILVIPGWIGNLTHDSDLHDTATWMESYADERGWEYPENYVFAESRHNPMLNYFVNGEPTYWYARSEYNKFLVSASATQWYETLHDRNFNRNFRGPTGFVVTTDGQSTAVADSMYARLHNSLGSATKTAPGLAHYRLVYQHPTGSPKVFTLTDGATISGTAAGTTDVPLSAPVSAPNVEFTYRRQVAVNESGQFSVTVPYPGTYTIDNRTVRVSETDVTRGRSVTVSNASS